MLIPLAILGILAVFLIGEKVCVRLFGEAARRHGKTDPRSCSITTEGPSPSSERELLVLLRRCREYVPADSATGRWLDVTLRTDAIESALTGTWVNPPGRYEGNDVA